MVRFLTSLDVRDIDNHDWQLLAAFVVEVAGKLYRVPAGFVTDFASVPRLPLAFLLFGNVGHRGAVLHDWLYRSAGVPRADADAVFREVLKAEGVGAMRAGLMYAGVRAFGSNHYGAGDDAA